MKRFKSGYKAGWLCFLAIIFLIQGLMCQGNAWGLSSSGLSLSLHTDSDHAERRFTLGEPIEIIMVLSNITTGSIATDRGFSQLELHHSLIVEDPAKDSHILAAEDTGNVMNSPLSLNGEAWVPAEELENDWVRSVKIQDLSELIPMMKTTPGWYTIKAQQPFIRYSRTMGAGVGLLAFLGNEEDQASKWSGTVDAEPLQILVSPAQNGAQIKVRTRNTTEDPATPLAQVPVRVFRVSDLPQGYSLADVWDQSQPVLTGATDFDGWAVWDAGTPCVEEENYIAVAYYSNAYKESLIAPGEGWAAECSGSIERVIDFVEELFPPLSRFSIFAANSVWIKSGAVVNSGNIGVLEKSTGLWLDSGVEISLGIGARAEDGVQIFGDSVKIRRRASLDDVFCNELDNRGTVRGEITEGLELPLPLELPAFPDIQPGSKNITVHESKTKRLFPGNYRNVTVASRGKLRLKGGEYHFKNLILGYRSKLICLAPVEIRIKNRLSLGFQSRLVPRASSGLTAKDVVLYVEGTNGKLWDLLSYPKAADLGVGTKVKANVYAPNGTIFIGADSNAIGSYIAKGVVVGWRSRVTLDSAF